MAFNSALTIRHFYSYIMATFCMFSSFQAVSSQPVTQGLWKGGWDNRYFSYNGEFPYYVGIDLQQLVSDTGLDKKGLPGNGYKSRLDLMADYDINKVRIWLNTAWFPLNDTSIIYPWKKVNGKFDLKQWDDVYWLRLADMVDYAATKGIIVEISIFSVQGPMDYFKNTQKDKPYIFSYAFRNDNNIQNFGKPNKSKHFLPEFFNLNYSEGDQELVKYQKAYIDKILSVLGDKKNIYFELMNEAPGRIKKNKGECSGLVWGAEYAKWANTMLSYIKSKQSSPQLVTLHTNGYMNIANNCSFEVFDKESARFWQQADVDGMNFHFYTGDPHDVANYLHSHQRKGKMLLNNEGDEYYNVDRAPGYPNFILKHDTKKLQKEIRHAWGHAISGSYYTIYHGPVPQFTNSAVVVEALKFAQAMRHIMEKVPFHTMRPIRLNDGSEYDDLIKHGPASDWQLLVNEGEAYLAYFWNNQTTKAVEINLAPGDYRYEWYDVRSYDKHQQDPSLRSGEITAIANDSTTIPAPKTSTWDQGAGLALVIRRKNNTTAVSASLSHSH